MKIWVFNLTLNYSQSLIQTVDSIDWKKWVKREVIQFNRKQLNHNKIRGFRNQMLSVFLNGIIIFLTKTIPTKYVYLI